MVQDKTPGKQINKSMEGLKRIQEISQFVKDHPQGTVYIQTHYFEAQFLGRVLAGIRTRMIVGAETESDLLVIQILAESGHPIYKQ